MKVAFTHHIFSLQEVGGVSRYFGELIGILRCRKYSEADVAINYSKNRYINSLLPKIQNKNIKNRLIIYLVNEIYSLFFIWKNYDLIHNTYYFPVIKFTKKPKIVMTIHDTIIFKYENGIKSKLVKFALRLAIHQACHIIVVSNATKRELIAELGVNEKKISVVYLGVIQPNHYFVETKKDFNTVLFVGSRSGYKNFNLLVNAFGILSKASFDATLRIYGGGSLSESEIRLLNSFGFNKIKYQYIDGGDDQSLMDIYSTSCVLVYPSKIEGFGLPPLEAMANRCPVIISNTPALVEISGSASHIFELERADQLASGIIKILTEPNYAKRLIEAGLGNIVKYKWDDMEANTIEVYKKVLRR
jgi:glycosyltransferase involved in cell wall biosynthesis